MNFSSSAKRFKLSTKSFQLSNRTNCSSVYSNMPADIFFKICSFLNLKDICRLGRVCVRWYRLTRSEIVWYRIDIAEQNLYPEAAHKLLCSLPLHVEQLRIGYRNGSHRQVIKLPDIFYELRKRCPNLNVLIIQNAVLAKSAFHLMSGFMLNCKVPEKEQVLGYYTELKYNVQEDDMDFRALYYFLRNVSMLSLRKSVFAVEDIFPGENIRIPPSKIKVLDLTESLSATDRAVVSFCRLSELEELYLSGTAVTINGVLTVLTTLRGLKVLDLDSTVVGGETFAVLRKYGKSLTEIYMGETAVKDTDLIDTDERSFPNLRRLCLARTRVTQIGIHKLLDSLSTLRSVIVTQSCVIPGWIMDLPRPARAKLEFESHENSTHCNHFLDNKYRGIFRNRHYSSAYK